MHAIARAGPGVARTRESRMNVVRERRAPARIRSHQAADPGQPPLKILVLGADSRSFLSVIRSLGRAGHEIHVAWAPEGSVALSSRYVRKRHELSAWRANDPAWIARFESLLTDNAVDLVIPCSDPVIIPMQAIQGAIRTHAKFCILPGETWRLASSKSQMYRLASELGIPLAKAVTVASDVDVRAALEVLEGPWVFKPDCNYSASDLETGHVVRKATTRESALALGAEYLIGGPFQVQENFVGVGTGVEVLCDRGEVLLAFQHLRIHELRHGGSSYRKGVDIHPAMIEATKALMARLEYTGVAMVEFKWNPAKDQWIFIELNARFWGSLPLAVASGADFPRALVDLLMTGRRDFDYRIRRGLYARNLRLDIDWQIANLTTGRNDPMFAGLARADVAREALNVVRGIERWDTLALDDPAPFWREILHIASTKYQALLRRIDCSRRFLAWTAARRRKRLAHCLPRARHVTFVCHGNICRSPFAEACASRRIDGLRFSSVGFHRVEGRAPPAAAIAAAREFGIDLSGHRSRRLKQDMTQAADVLFAFDAQNLKEMYVAYPGARMKTFLLSDLGAAVPPLIGDPWGQGLETFLETYRSIEICIDALAR